MAGWIDGRRLGELDRTAVGAVAADRFRLGLLVPGAEELGDRERDSGLAVVFVFFRDTNLTDVLFRLDEQFLVARQGGAGP